MYGVHVCVSPYVSRSSPLYHFDFYRLSCAPEAQDIGFEEYCDAGGIIIVEWADKFPQLLPAVRLACLYILLP